MKEVIKEIADLCGGKVESIHGPLPDGSGFALVTYPLPSDHWMTKSGDEDPPTPYLIGTDSPLRKLTTTSITRAARYAVRSATNNGKITDFDPDAMVQAFVVGMLGYHTSDGKSHL